jgi:hypothetical protein
MLGMRRRPPAPETDSQMRVRVVHDEAKKLEDVGPLSPEEAAAAVHKLAYCVSYLAAIVEKHLRTGER